MSIPKQETMWIIESLLDIDFYKLTMGQFVFHRYRNIPVRYGFINRTKGVCFADVIDEAELRRELDHARTLWFKTAELDFLRGITKTTGDPLFQEDYLEFLQNFHLPEYSLVKRDGEYVLEFSGTWAEAIYWETIALCIVNELYYRSLMRRMTEWERGEVYATGISRLFDKITLLEEKPDVRFIEFGTRRRFSRDWQEYVVRMLAKKLPNQLLGTSNTLLAMKHGLSPRGTFAHELAMGLSGVMHGSDEEIRASQNRVIQEWEDEYAPDLLIALDDTYGTDAFLEDMTYEQAVRWQGLRQDSGDPIEVGEKWIAFYKRHVISAQEKILFCSDGLDVPSMIKISDHFQERIQTLFGPGTNFTNDLGPAPVSIVVKLLESNGHGAVKLSNNMAKATGRPEDIERFKRIFRYTGTLFEACKY